MLSYSIAIPLLNANSEDPDQTPRSAATDLGLHCLPLSLLWDANSLSVICDNDLS